MNAKVWVCFELIGDKKIYLRVPSTFFKDDGDIDLQSRNGFVKIEEDIYSLVLVPDPSNPGMGVPTLLSYGKHPPEKLQKPYYISLASITMISRLPPGEIQQALDQKVTGIIQTVASKLVI